MPMLIDSHHHLWRYSADEYPWISEEMAALRQDFLLDELHQVATDHRIDGFVTVQARQTTQETSWLLALARQTNSIRGVVGWLPLASDEIEAGLESISGSPLLKGLRHVVQDEPDDRFLLGEAFNRGIAQLRKHNLVYDLLVFARQLPATIEFVDRHPDQIFVLDHIAKPTIRGGAIDEDWEKCFRQLAKRENVSCKFSGVVTEVRDADWDLETIRGYWNVAVEAFGTERLMFGSDWPVCLLRSDYGEWLETVRTLADSLSADEQSAFFSGNAIRAYQLDTRAT